MFSRKLVQHMVIDTTHTYTELCNIGRLAKTDKTPYGDNNLPLHRHPYTGVYSVLFSPLKNKEIEFEKLTNLKDEKLRELEECLSFISKETESQNQKIKQNLNDQYLKEEQLKKYIFQLENKIEIIKKKLNEKDKIIKFLEQKINVLIPPNVYTSEYKVTNY